NYAASTGDVDELSRLSAATCEGCQSYITLYRKTYDAGGYFKGADWTLGDLKLREAEGTSYVTTLAKADPGQYRETANDPERTSTGQDNEVSFAVSRAKSTWQVDQLGLGGVE
ncbi:MAG: hypothetical protein JWQ91_440, partial [Aeromicrobium sp.]|uniref:DUF6318 family protein n=1 Tax=Aeromicrobium sp. TaxID=1871063 RepID=UPI002611DB9B